jgi:hypothetical protein
MYVQMKAVARAFLLLLLALDGAACQACYAPPQAQSIGPDEQLQQATDVALARVTDARQIGATVQGTKIVAYLFRVLERLAGSGREEFTLQGWAREGQDSDTTFNDHAHPAFWSRGGGRTRNDMDCAIHPSFTVGASYLVFLGSPATWRSYERIDMRGGAMYPADKWLAHVKAWLGR